MDLCLAVRLEGSSVRVSCASSMVHADSLFNLLNWFERCGELLGENPALWGVSSEPRVFFVQVDDVATADFLSLGFGRRTGQMTATRLIPDAYFIGTDGYDYLRRPSALGQMPRWRDRHDIVLWRGTTTGTGPFAEPTDIPRVKLAVAARAIPGADVRIMGIFERVGRWIDIERLAHFLEAEQLLGERTPMGQYAGVRYTIDIDGYANAWSLVEKLLCGCCVLKVTSPFEQWFYDRLHAWEHYVPVASDFSDLEARLGRGLISASL